MRGDIEFVSEDQLGAHYHFADELAGALQGDRTLKQSKARIPNLLRNGSPNIPPEAGNSFGTPTGCAQTSSGGVLNTPSSYARRGEIRATRTARGHSKNRVAKGS